MGDERDRPGPRTAALRSHEVRAEGCRSLAEVRQRRRPDTGVDAVAGCSDERNARSRRPARPTGPVALVYLVERRGLQPRTRLRDQPSRQRVLASRSPPTVVPGGPRDLLTRVADSRQDGPARALQRGLGESIPTAAYLFARCARSLEAVAGEKRRAYGGSRAQASCVSGVAAVPRGAPGSHRDHRSEAAGFVRRRVASCGGATVVVVKERATTRGLKPSP